MLKQPKLNIHKKNFKLEKASQLPSKINYIIHLATPSRDDSFLKDFRSTLSKYMQMMDFFEKLCYQNKPKIYYMSSGATLSRNMYSPIKKEFEFTLKEDPYSAIKKHDEERITLMSKNARRHMLSYDNSIIKEKLISIYKSYLGIKINEDT